MRFPYLLSPVGSLSCQWNKFSFLGYSTWKSSRSFFMNCRKNSDTQHLTEVKPDTYSTSVSSYPESSDLGPLLWCLQPVSHCDSGCRECWGLSGVATSWRNTQHPLSKKEVGEQRQLLPFCAQRLLCKETHVLCTPYGIGTPSLNWRWQVKMSLEKLKYFLPTLERKILTLEPVVSNQTNLQRSQITPLGMTTIS